MKYSLFGSPDGNDLDIVVYVDSIPSVTESRELINKYKSLLETEINTNKDLDINLGVLKDGIITQTFKGTHYECNNSIYYTQGLFNQPKHINRKYEINDDFILSKINKVIITCSSLLTRIGDYRSELKKSLKLLKDRYYNKDIYPLINLCEILLKINLTEYDLKKKNITETKILKTFAFQLIQLNELFNGQEIYYKEEMVNKFPELKQYLYYNPIEKNTIEEFKNRVINNTLIYLNKKVI